MSVFAARTSAVAALVAAVACGESPRSDDVDGSASEPFSGPAPKARPLTDVTFEVTPERLERGRYLANGVAMCIRCHSDPDTTVPGWPAREGMEGAGRVVWEEDGERMVAPNLTPDPETGAGTWPDDAIARAIREGVGHDGRALSRPMYWSSFRHLSDEDVASIVVYLRSLPAIRNPLPARVLSAERLADLAEDPEPLMEPVPGPVLSDPVERGRYLVRVGNCVGCHTSWYSDPRPGAFGGGNHIGNVFSTNISSDSSGVGAWSEEGFRQVIRTGRAGTLDPVMPWVTFARMTDEDLGAVFRALQEVLPVSHWITNLGEPTYCAACGQEHGLGDRNELVSITPTEVEPAVLSRYPGRYVLGDDEITVRLDAEALWLTEDDDTFHLAPLSETRFQVVSSSGPEFVEFGRDSSGAVTHFMYYWGLDEDRFVRQR